MVRAMLLGIMVYFSAQAALQLRPEFSRLALGIASLTVTGCFVAGRYVLYRIEWNLARHLPKIHRVLLYGDNEVSRRLLEDVRKEPFLRSEVVGMVRTQPDSDEAHRIAGLPLYSPEQADKLLEQNAFTQVIVTDLDVGRERLVDLIARCEDRFVQFRMVPDVFHTLTSGPEILWIGGTPVLGTRRWPLDYAGRRILKRASDISGAFVGLILCGPIILLAGMITKLTSPGPMFYRQERCGENGRVFGLLKIRTMRQDAEAPGKPGWTVPNDPRRTPVGAFLRRTNIDELPQLWNVLKGDMSLVGPRPERPFFVSQFKEEIDRYMHRHVYKPGITGWAQVHGLRGDTSIRERLKYDLYYLENWSLSLDFKILIKTFFSHKNAY